MEKKKSSIEWLAEQLIPNAMRMFDATTCNAIDQAKAMHKEEMKESYSQGRTDQQSSSDSFYNRNAEQYYNQTFGGE